MAGHSRLNSSLKAPPEPGVERFDMRSRHLLAGAVMEQQQIVSPPATSCERRLKILAHKRPPTPPVQHRSPSYRMKVVRMTGRIDHLGEKRPAGGDFGRHAHQIVPETAAPQLRADHDVRQQNHTGPVHLQQHAALNPAAVGPDESILLRIVRAALKARQPCGSRFEMLVLESSLVHLGGELADQAGADIVRGYLYHAGTRWRGRSMFDVVAHAGSVGPTGAVEQVPANGACLWLWGDAEPAEGPEGMSAATQVGSHPDRAGRMGMMGAPHGRPFAVTYETARKHLRRIRLQRAALLAAAAIMAAPAASPELAVLADETGITTPFHRPPIDPDADMWRITSFEADGHLDAGGKLTVTETIEIEWRQPRRGFYRTLPLDGSVTLASEPEVSSSTFPDVPYRTASRTGHAEIEIGGDTVRDAGTKDIFTVTYQLDGMVVRDGAAAAAAAADGPVPTLRWDTSGFDWSTTIRNLTVQLTSEVPFKTSGCAFGADGENTSCTQDRPDSRTVIWSADHVPVGYGITGQVTFPEDTFPTAEEVTLVRFELDSSPGGGGLHALIMLMAAAYAMYRTFHLRKGEREGLTELDLTPVRLQPPDGLTPVAAAALLSGIPSAVTSTGPELRLLGMVSRGVVTFSIPGPAGETRASYGTNAPSGPVEAELAGRLISLGDLRPGPEAARLAADMRQADLQEVKEARRRHPGFTARSRTAGPAGTLLTLAGAVFGILTYGPPVTLMLAAGYMIMAVRTGPAVGRVTWARLASASEEDRRMFRQISGFERFLAEAKADQLDQVAADPTIPVSSAYLEYLPWAAAFWLSDSWRESFDRQILQDAELRYGDAGRTMFGPSGVTSAAGRLRPADAGRSPITLGSAGRAAGRRSSGRARSGARSGRGGGGGRSR